MIGGQIKAFHAIFSSLHPPGVRRGCNATRATTTTRQGGRFSLKLAPQCCISTLSLFLRLNREATQRIGLFRLAEAVMKYWASAGNVIMHHAWQDYLNAFRNVTRQYRRAMFSIQAVAFGVLALILAAGFIKMDILGGTRRCYPSRARPHTCDAARVSRPRTGRSVALSLAATISGEGCHRAFSGSPNIGTQACLQRPGQPRGRDIVICWRRMWIRTRSAKRARYCQFPPGRNFPAAIRRASC